MWVVEILLQFQKSIGSVRLRLMEILYPTGWDSVLPHGHDRLVWNSLRQLSSATAMQSPAAVKRIPDADGKDEPWSRLRLCLVA